MRSVARLACGLAVLMALAGCTGDSPREELPGPPAATGEERPSTPAGSPTPGADGVGSRLSAGQLEAVLQAIDEAESLNAQVIPDAELRALEEEGAQRAEDIVVTPDECNLYAESSLGGPSANATRAAMTFAGESSLQPDTVSLSSLPSAEAAIADVQASRNQLTVCSQFTMEVSGREIMTTVAEVDVDTAADADLALHTRAQIPGTIQESITVRAVVDSTVLDVLVGSSTDPEADIARAERLVDLVVAELRVL